MKKLTTEEWVTKAEANHGKLYNYSEVDYKNSTTKVLIGCILHGIFEQNPRNHISEFSGKNGCPKCTGRGLSTDEWIARFNEVHNNKFNYSKFTYTGIFDKVVIICKKHGEFTQNAHNHSQGQQCPECSKETTWLGNSYYNVTNAIRHMAEWKTIDCSVYLVSMHNGIDKAFYKIGITAQSIDRRFRPNNTPYKVNLVKEFKTNRYEAILIENLLHQANSAIKYSPLTKFQGHTECFSAKPKGL